MDVQEFQHKRSEILTSLHALENDYALSKAKFSIGDIIESKNAIILIDEVFTCKRQASEYLPTVVYRGLELTKQKTLRKDKKRNGMAEDKIIFPIR